MTAINILLAFCIFIAGMGTKQALEEHYARRQKEFDKAVKREAERIVNERENI